MTSLCVALAVNPFPPGQRGAPRLPHVPYVTCYAAVSALSTKSRQIVGRFRAVALPDRWPGTRFKHPPRCSEQRSSVRNRENRNRITGDLDASTACCGCACGVGANNERALGHPKADALPRATFCLTNPSYRYHGALLAARQRGEDYHLDYGGEEYLQATQ